MAIIGSGPAGLTAAIYAARANLKTLVLAGQKWGGQLMLTTTVENFPGFPEGVQGPQLMENMKTQAEKFGAQIILEDVVAVSKSATGYELRATSSKYSARAVIIASGADTQWLGLPNELRLIGHGVSSCAPCDAFFFKNKKVAVVGGGDSAMEEALFLTKFASEVTIIHRRGTFRASKIMQDRVLNNPKIKVLFNTEVVDVLGETHVEGLLLKDASHQSLVTSHSFDGLFVAVGHKVNDQFVKDLAGIEGVFIAGDVVDLKYKQAVTAAATGCQAAMDVEKWLEFQAKNSE